MFELKVKDLVLEGALKQLLEVAYGEDFSINGKNSNLTITDTLDSCGQALSKQKNIVFLSEHVGGLDKAFESITHISLPLKPTALIQKLRQVTKKITVPDLNKIIKIQGLTFDPSEFLLISNDDGLKTTLTEKERNILVLLFEAGDEAVSREVMLEKIWNYAPDLETHTLETHIYRLRQKIEQDPAQPKILVTEEKGYRLLT
jgi:DNA-binding response OmpR family regulator